ncbi:hypothetical protein R1flu_025079 [Riccia fluitans]|uniref:Uncharacterized protein n=1 Tax=Riccia fluitans TaxID=41844 RepID=A0ABD1XWQ5_9MARC
MVGGIFLCSVTAVEYPDYQRGHHLRTTSIAELYRKRASVKVLSISSELIYPEPLLIPLQFHRRTCLGKCVLYPSDVLGIIPHKKPHYPRLVQQTGRERLQVN